MWANKSTPTLTGRNFSYCTGGVFVLSEILGKSPGARRIAMPRRNCSWPLGITNVQWVSRPRTFPNRRRLLVDQPRPTQIAQLYLDGGRWQGRPACG